MKLRHDDDDDSHSDALEALVELIVETNLC
jgi:hypothetical protein